MRNVKETLQGAAVVMYFVASAAATAWGIAHTPTNMRYRPRAGVMGFWESTPEKKTGERTTFRNTRSL